MNICYIAANTNIPSRKANSVHVMKMCQAYANLGHRVTLVLPKLQGTEPGVEDVYAFYGVRPEFMICKVSLPRGCPDLIYNAVIKPLVALRSKPDIIHTRGLVPAWAMTNLFGIPTIYEIHHPYQRPFPCMLFNKVVNSPHLHTLAVITYALANCLRPNMPENIHLQIAPDGVDDEWLRHSVSQHEAREELELSFEKRRIVAYVGGLYQGRGVELIIELAQSLKDHLFLIVGGNDDVVSHYRQKTESLRNLQFLGFKPPAKVHLYLQAADVLIMPYSHQVKLSNGKDTSAYASPMKMFEYMAAGRPILASTLPVLQEVLQDGVNALLIPYDQPNRWVEALERLRQDRDIATKLGNRARHDVEQYTWESRAQKLLSKADS